jgi:hypothetical protein
MLNLLMHNFLSLMIMIQPIMNHFLNKTVSENLFFEKVYNFCPKE